MSTDWPADAGSLAAAREFIDSCTGKVVVAAHNDTDGLCAAVIVLRALAARGVDAEPLPARRGEHVHQDAMRSRITDHSPDALVVLDMGTRPGPVVPGVPTLIVDHHDATAGAPSDAIIVNGYDREPVAPSSVLAFVVCRHVPGAGGHGLARGAWCDSGPRHGSRVS
jgi:single-stranded-DNA-specific exonuclease